MQTKTVPTEPTNEMVAAALKVSLEIMKEHGVTGLSPFEDYPNPVETTRRMLRAAIDAADPYGRGVIAEATDF